MESYIKSVREQLTKKKSKSKKIKIGLDKFDSEEVFSKLKKFKNKIKKGKSPQVQKTALKPKLEKKDIKAPKSHLILSPSRSELETETKIKHRRNISMEKIIFPTIKKKKKNIKKPMKRSVSESLMTTQMETQRLNNSKEITPKKVKKIKVNQLNVSDVCPVNSNFDIDEFFEIHSSFTKEPEDDKIVEYDFDDEDNIFESFEKAEILDPMTLKPLDSECSSVESETNSPAVEEILPIFSAIKSEECLSQISESYVVELPTYSSYDLTKGKILIIEKNKPIALQGYVKLDVYHGVLQIFGKTFKENQSLNVYSPRGTALFTLENTTKSDISTNIKLGKLLPKLKEHEKLNDVNVQKNSLILYCTQINNPKVLFLEEHISQQIFPKPYLNMPAINLNPENTNTLKINPEWDSTLSRIEANSKFMIVGGKGVGKSTFLRYSINKLLEVFSRVRVIDLDPGQSEFTVPGCLSILTVDKMLFEPNYLHLKKPEISILSNINVGNEPGSYIRAVKHLIEINNKMEPLPTIINYMGFNAGIGLNLVCSAIFYVQPTHVAQINSQIHKKNFACPLTIENVGKNSTLFCCDVKMSMHYELITISSMTDFNDAWSLEPRQMREMSILTYFGEMMSDEVLSITNPNIPMFETSLSSVKIVDNQGKPSDPSTANANLVALCSLQDENFICHGWGIVRGIDCLNDKIVLITPEKAKILDLVDYLVVGCMNLPPTIYMNTKESSGMIPYVMESELDALSQFTKRVFKPPHK
ncbi:unnamed protein product [Brassicogethes aeneus]|uniref:Polynucleotide 5'-hydroxyl-kinase NOL9 n=1 Tax=Brassicogethes aeneus TaxID=1431903 RepID=A0A9P0FF89_BRAAE|nr:unnamed protein product [Brassicogethes aeneus]